MSEKIENDIIKNLETFLSQKLSPKYYFSSSYYDATIQINGIENKVDGENTMFIRVGINKDNKQIYISNLFVPFKLKHQNIGKKLISIIYQSSLEYCFDVFLVDLTEGFYNRMLKRGAVKCDQPDILHIDKKTILE